MTCRDEILRAIPKVVAGRRDGVFRPKEVVDYLAKRGSRFDEMTIRTHISSRMCVDAPPNHAVTYPDLERVGRGLYRMVR